MFFYKKCYIQFFSSEFSSLEFSSSEFLSSESSLSQSSEEISMLPLINLDVFFSLTTHLHSSENTILNQSIFLIDKFTEY